MPQYLRNQIISKDIPITRLVKMTANEMAKQEIIEARQIISEKVSDERRTDWLEAHREEIMKTNGLDPNNKWDFDDDDGSGSENPEEGD